MNKKLLLILFFGFSFSSIYAQTEISNCAASPDPIIIDNGGVPLTIIGKGTQSNSWTETVDGHIIKKNARKEFEYVIKNAQGKIMLSGKKATNETSRSRSINDFIKATPENTRALVQQSLTKIELTSSAPFAASSISVFTNTAMPTTGSIKVLCLLVDYPDKANNYSKANFENLLNQPNYNGTGSFKDYFTNASFGKLDVTVDVIDWVTAPNNFEYYGRANGYGRARELVRFAVDQAELSGLDFSQYDNDGDGDVDGIMVIHAGQGAEEGSQTQYIWSHSWSIPSVEYDGVLINEYIINPETRASSAMTDIGVFCHEFGHNLGLPDLYDTDGSSQGIGNWGLMGSASWLGGGKRPGGPSAWSKVKLGWQVPTEISSNGSFVLNPAASNEEIYLINPGEGKEFFLLENRQKEGIDQALPGTGLTIWHIDDAKYSNSDETHKRVDVEEADGLNGLDNGSRGDAGDLYPGTSGNTVFNGSSDPNNQLYGGGINPARILNIVENPDKTISFETDFDPVKFTPFDTISFQPTAISQSKEKKFSIKAYNYDFTITSVVYPDGFSGGLVVGDIILEGTESEFSIFFNPTFAKKYKDEIVVTGVSNGSSVNGKIKVKGTGLQLIFADDFETDKGWVLNGFDRGAPQGLGGDPAIAFEGANVLGNVLGGTGNYDNNLADREWTATSPSFSSYGYSNIQLNFQQWLNLSNYDQDFANLDVSIDGGSTWKQILLYGDWEIVQTDWWQIWRDISDYIAWEKDVQIRFSLGKTDASNVNGGWNIDNLLITGEAEAYQLSGQLNFGVTGIGINKTRVLTLKNGTPDNFTITNISLPSGYTTNLVIGDVISAGLQSSFNILFSPELKQAYDGSFTLEFTDGINNFSETLPIKGSGDYLIFEDDFETDKGWILTGGFEIGTPLGRGYDPFNTVSGETVLGTVLTGNGKYENNLTDREWLATSPIIDCSAFTNVALNFAKFNQIDGSYDSAYVDVSIDAGTTWSQVWSTEGRWVGNWQWENQIIDISSLVDGKASVMVRFSLGATDSNWTYAGWNIDDVSLSGDTDVAIEVTEKLIYGDVLLGASTANDIIIKNVGIQDLVITSIDYPTDFSGENYTGTLVSGASKTISVSFDPTEIKNYQDTLKVISNAATGNYQAVFTGLGKGAKIRVSNAMDFGDVFVDSTSMKSIYIVNEGNSSLNVTGVVHSSAVFSGSWTGIINPNDSVKVNINFTPSDAILYSNFITVNSDAVVGIGNASFTGTGVLPIRSISLSRTFIDFGNVPRDTTVIDTVYIINNGNLDLNIYDVLHANNAFSSPFTGVIKPMDSVVLRVEFTPPIEGLHAETMIVQSNATSGDSLVLLSGNGIILYSKLEVDLSTIDFDSVRVDSTKIRWVEVSNKGNSSLLISDVLVNNTAFSVDWTEAIISSLSSKLLKVQFLPNAQNDYSATLTFISNADSGLFEVVLKGTGLAGEIFLSGNIDFGEAEIEEEVTDTLYISNIGNASFKVEEVRFSDPSLTGTYEGTLSAGETESVLVKFIPTEAKSYEMSLQVVHSAEFGVDTLALNGIGLDVIAGVNDSMKNLSLYPNPTSGIISVLDTDNSEASYVVINELGKILLKGILLKEIDLSSLPNGIYSIRIYSNEQEKVLKVILQR